MLSQQLVRSSRISLRRPLRPPSRAYQPSTPRLFTPNSQLLLVARNSLRPQIPYLSQPAAQRQLVKQDLRLLTTESRNFVRNAAYLTVKAVSIAAFLLVCLGFINWGLLIERAERKRPTPREWSFRTREFMRDAQNALEAGLDGRGIVNWPYVASRIVGCLARLEHADYEGAGLENLGKDGENVFIDGVGRTAFDVSSKSYPWKKCYFDACMICARAAEHLDNSVRDVTRGLVFPREVMIGPSNPDPRPTPPYMKAAPLEENCQKAFWAPEAFYMRILTGVGFTTRQRLDAALAYANWLEFKDLQESAGEVYKWAIDITKSALGTDPDTIIDPKTAILTGYADQNASPNLLRATTSLAVFNARNGQVGAALPIMLSILRARRNAFSSPTSGEPNYMASTPSDRTSASTSSFAWFTSFLSPPPFPSPPPSGDDPLVRRDVNPSWEDNELMLYVGEILFATDPRSNEGLAWTRQAVTTAEKSLEDFESQNSSSETPPSLWNFIFPGPEPEGSEEGERWKDCLFSGVENWETMLRRLIEEQALGKSRGNGGLRSWFGLSKVDAPTAAELDAELAHVAALKDKIIREGIAREMFKVKGQTGGTWVG